MTGYSIDMRSWRRLSGAVVVAIALGFCLAVAPAQSQIADAAEDDTEVEEVVVTGTRIARKDFSSISPIATIDRTEMTLSGAANIEDLLNALPQIVPAFNRTSNNPGNGVAQINLRGLGPKRTLVLLNGRRFVPTTLSGNEGFGGGAVDVNNIPSVLVERIEVVTGGASAVYGSDAVSGVVNFILRDDFEGAEVNAQFDITDAGDGEVYDLSLALGHTFAGGRGHAAVFYNYNKRTTVFQSDREFTDVFVDDDFETGEIFEGGSSGTPATRIFFPGVIDGVFAADGITFNPDGTPRAFREPEDRFNFAPDNFLQTPLDRHAVGAFAHYDLSDNITAFVEFNFVHNDSDQELAPTPAFAFVAVNVDNPVLTPETQTVFRDNFDDGSGLAFLFLGRRMEEVGSRIVNNVRDLWRVVVGLKGEVFEDWSWEGYYSYSKVDQVEDLINDVSAARFQQALLVDAATGQCFDPTGGCVPLDIFGEGRISGDAADFIRFEPLRNPAFTKEQIASASMTGDLIELPAGPVGTAFGAEWRRDDAQQTADEALFTGDTLGFFPFEPIKGGFEVWELFAEAVVPVLAGVPLAEYLGFEFGLRYSDYTTAGSVWTWKSGAEWQVIPSLRFRGMFQRAVRAPNILELFEAQTELPFGFTSLDQCSASRDPVGKGVADICIAQGIPADQIGVFEALRFFDGALSFGGNPDLEEERANSFTVGVVVEPEPVSGLTVSIDYFNIRIKDAIQTLGGTAFNVLPLCFRLGDPTSQFCQAVERGPTGDITNLRAPQSNVAQLESTGIDVQINYRFEVDRLGLGGAPASFALSIFGTRLIRHAVQPSPLEPSMDCAGFFGFPCGFSSLGTLPKYRTTSRLTYSSGPLSLSLRWRWIAGTRNGFILIAESLSEQPLVLAIPRIGDENTFDLSFAFEVHERVDIYGGVSNIFENDPPLLAGQQGQANTDPSLYDPLGRRFFIGVTARY